MSDYQVGPSCGCYVMSLIEIPSALDWIPLLRVGPFLFSEPIPAGIQSQLEERPDRPGDGITLKIRGRPDDFIEVYLEEGLVFSVECRVTMTYNNSEIIGVNEDTLTKILGFKPSESEEMELSDCVQKLLCWDSLSLIATLEQGKVISACCYDGSTD